MEKVVSIFSGMDVLGMGFSSYFELALAVEKDPTPCELMRINRKKHSPHMEIWERDIYTVTDEEILAWKGITGIIGGPNCQPFSSAKGAFDPKDPRIQGLWEYLRWVRLLQPEFFVFENTFGLLEGTKRTLFEQFQEDAEALGYEIEAKVINAYDYGSVQTRKRLIAVGVKKEATWRFVFPSSVPQEERLVSTIEDILDPTDVGPTLRYSPERERIVSFVPEGGNWKDLPTQELKIQAMGEKNFFHPEGGMTGAYRRLARNKPCPTLTTNPCQRNTMVTHPEEDRPLSLHEYKRAFGIPNNYVLRGPLLKLYKAVGNSVPYELAKRIAKQITKNRSEKEGVC